MSRGSVRPDRLAVVCCTAVLTCALSLLAGCPDETPEIAAVAGTEGRSRYVVTMTATPPDLEAWRALRRDKPDDVAAFVEKERSNLALAQASLDQVVAGLGGRIVSRWWTSGQVTIEISPAAVATVRAIPGVTAVDPDRPLQ